MRVEQLLVHVRSSDIVGMPSALLLQSVFPVLHFGLLNIKIPTDSIPAVESILEKCGPHQSARLIVSGEVMLDHAQDGLCPDAIKPTKPIRYYYVLKVSKMEDCWGPAAF